MSTRAMFKNGLILRDGKNRHSNLQISLAHYTYRGCVLKTRNELFDNKHSRNDITDVQSVVYYTNIRLKQTDNHGNASSQRYEVAVMLNRTLINGSKHLLLALRQSYARLLRD